MSDTSQSNDPTLPGKDTKSDTFLNKSDTTFAPFIDIDCLQVLLLSILTCLSFKLLWKSLLLRELVSKRKRKVRPILPSRYQSSSPKSSRSSTTLPKQESHSETPNHGPTVTLLTAFSMCMLSFAILGIAFELFPAIPACDLKTVMTSVSLVFAPPAVMFAAFLAILRTEPPVRRERRPSESRHTHCLAHGTPVAVCGCRRKRILGTFAKWMVPVVTCALEFLVCALAWVFVSPQRDQQYHCVSILDTHSVFLVLLITACNILGISTFAFMQAHHVGTSKTLQVLMNQLGVIAVLGFTWIMLGVVLIFVGWLEEVVLQSYVAGIMVPGMMGIALMTAPIVQNVCEYKPVPQHPNSIDRDRSNSVIINPDFFMEEYVNGPGLSSNSIPPIASPTLPRTSFQDHGGLQRPIYPNVGRTSNASSRAFRYSPHVARRGQIMRQETVVTPATTETLNSVDVSAQAARNAAVAKMNRTRH